MKRPRNKTLRLIRCRLSLALDRFEAGADAEAAQLLETAVTIIRAAGAIEASDAEDHP